MPAPDLYQPTMADVLSPELKKATRDYFWMEQLRLAGCTHEKFGDKGSIPSVPMERRSVFRTTKEMGTYNHHACIVKWRGRFWYGWSNGIEHELRPGQRCTIASSDDAYTWSEPRVFVEGSVEKGIVRCVGGLYPWGDTLFALVRRLTNYALATDPGMVALDLKEVACTYDLYETSDGESWKLTNAEHIDVNNMIEKPRLTNEGRLLAPASDQDLRPVAVLWPGDDPREAPRIIPIPLRSHPDDYHQGHDYGQFPYGEASFYTDDDNRIWFWHRDESGSGYLHVTTSEDGGETWSELYRTNFPDSVSRVFAGRLPDGRYYLVGNATRVVFDRNFFAITLSDDGAKFNRMYRLVAEPTRQRFTGHLKCHGYQYPSCLVDGDRLLVAYSINKEDMEIGIVDIGTL